MPTETGLLSVIPIFTLDTMESSFPNKVWVDDKQQRGQNLQASFCEPPPTFQGFSEANMELCLN